MIQEEGLFNVQFGRRIRDRILGKAQGVSPRHLRRILSGGSAFLRIQAFREIGAQRHGGFDAALAAGLSDIVPGIRRSAAFAIGQIAHEADSLHLVDAARRERCDAPRFSMAMAAVRCGVRVEDAWAIVESGANRSMATYYGRRHTAQAVGAGVDVLASLWNRLLVPGEETSEKRSFWPAEDLRAELRERIQTDPDDRDSVVTLGLLEHPDDWPVFQSLTKGVGRRMQHAICMAMGLNGDPRSEKWLLNVLEAMDVDPGHGFTSRTRSAAALGALGLPRVGPRLVRALETEALEHEGRPGAGLGIQKSVRTAILGALGESCAAPATVVSYLGDTQGTATGGFYLPAMDSAWKMDARDELAPLLNGPELPAANAVGVLGALGHTDLLAPLEGDPRPRVAQAILDAGSV